MSHKQKCIGHTTCNDFPTCMEEVPTVSHLCVSFNTRIVCSLSGKANAAATDISFLLQLDLESITQPSTTQTEEPSPKSLLAKEDAEGVCIVNSR